MCHGEQNECEKYTYLHGTKCNDYKTAKERAKRGGRVYTLPACHFCRLPSVPIQNFIFFLFLKNYIG